MKSNRNVPVGHPTQAPAHVAIIMDGNRRWARDRLLPVGMGHVAGARRVQEVVQACAESGVKVLTLFAFSTENWRRPPQEVKALMALFAQVLKRQTKAMKAAGVRLRVLGDRQVFSADLKRLIEEAESQTLGGEVLTLQVAANYGGRWDMLQAVKAWQRAHPEKSLDTLDEEALVPWLSGGDLPEVDLLIRTGGEQRISNFLLWQAAYAEFYFTPVLWPAFGPAELRAALVSYSERDRRFGSSGSSLAV